MLRSLAIAVAAFAATALLIIGSAGRGWGLIA